MKLEAKQLGANVKEVSISILHSLYECAYHPENYRRISDSIERDGMDFPLVVHVTTAKKWRALYDIEGDKIKAPPEYLGDLEEVNLVMCGNNRLDIAINTGYTSIDCILCSTKDEVNTWCGMMRKHWRSKVKESMDSTLKTSK